MMDKIVIDGVVMTKAEVASMREQVIAWRDESFKYWPDSVGDTLTTTYLIGFLAGVLEQYPNDMTADEFLAKFGHKET